MTLRGLDTEEDCSALTKGQVDFVCRYFSQPGAAKNLSPAEARALSAAGIGIVSVFETSINRALGGAQNGAYDAALALQCAAMVGQPKGTTIFWTLDMDIGQSSWPAVEAYAAAWNAAMAAAGYDIGSAYCGGAIVNNLKTKGLIKCRWLSGSMGYDGSRAARDANQWEILQGVGNALGLNVGGMDIDSDEGQGDDLAAIGAWMLTPAQLAALPPTDAAGIKAFQAAHPPLAVDGVWGPASQAAWDAQTPTA